MLGNFYHVVYFWLKEPDNQAVRNQFLSNITGFLDQVDEIVTRHLGSPAPTYRSVIDSSYTFSLILSFKNKKEQDIYQEHTPTKSSLLTLRRCGKRCRSMIRKFYSR